MPLEELPKAVSLVQDALARQLVSDCPQSRVERIARRLVNFRSVNRLLPKVIDKETFLCDTLGRFKNSRAATRRLLHDQASLTRQYNRVSRRTSNPSETTSDSQQSDLDTSFHSVETTESDNPDFLETVEGESSVFF